MSGELALRLIRSLRTTTTESPTVNDSLPNNNTNKQLPAITEEIDIVPYKCLCPYSTTLSGGKPNYLKKFSRFVRNIPCDRPCPVNLYRHLRNYHKVDLQHAKDITRTVMLSKAVVKSEISTDNSQAGSKASVMTRKRAKLPVRLK